MGPLVWGTVGEDVLESLTQLESTRACDMAQEYTSSKDCSLNESGFELETCCLLFMIVSDPSKMVDVF